MKISECVNAFGGPKSSLWGGMIQAAPKTLGDQKRLKAQKSKFLD